MSEPVIRMSSRLVEAAGRPWAPWSDEFAEPGVALDFLSSLVAQYGPTVVRVEVEGGAYTGEEGRVLEKIEGLWLCGDGDAPNAPLRRAAWDHSDAAWAWASNFDALTAWETCPDARWLIFAAAMEGVAPRTVIGAACACVRLAADALPASEPKPEATLSACERWAGGERTRQILYEAEGGAIPLGPGAAARTRLVFDAAQQVLNAALVYGSKDAFGEEAADAVLSASGSMTGELREAWPAVPALTRLADVARSRVPTIAYLRALRFA